MPTNRNALIRYKTIDKALRNRQRNWTLDDLIEACADALYEYEGIDSVSKRTIQGDLQMMRSDKLGYNAPIEVVQRKYYRYSDPEYSITNIPLTDQDLDMLMDAVEFMKQFQGFKHFQQLGGMVQKLEDHIHSSKVNTAAVIDFEKNEHLRGLEYLDPLYQAIVAKKSVMIRYQSFKSRTAQSFCFHPYILKEFRNRWFVIGVQDKGDSIMNLALDRIQLVDTSDIPLRDNIFFDPKHYFEQAIGVTISPSQKVEHVEFFVPHNHAPYIATKPLHASQKIESRNQFGVYFSIQVQLNFELEKTILGFGENIRVIQPARLRRSIIRRLESAGDIYRSDLQSVSMEGVARQFLHKGFVFFNAVYINRALNRISAQLDRVQSSNLMDHAHILNTLADNEGLHRILQTFGNKHFLFRANLKQSNQKDGVGQWKQQDPVPTTSSMYDLMQHEFMPIKLELSAEQWEREVLILSIYMNRKHHRSPMDVSLYAGSHKRRLTEEAMELITGNTSASTWSIPRGGVLLYHPNLLLRQDVAEGQKAKKRIDLYVWSPPT